MKKAVFILVIVVFIGRLSLAQTDPDQVAKSSVASIGVNIPAGEFAKTHFIGLGVDYAWSHHRFGQLAVLPAKWLGFNASGGISYYFGKKETTAGYDYRYGNYFDLYAFGGIIYNPVKKANIAFAAGPIMNLYKDNADFGFGAKWNASYYANNRLAIDPGIFYSKYSEAAALWTILLHLSYNF
jgi:hypothetical protein